MALQDNMIVVFPNGTFFSLVMFDGFAHGLCNMNKSMHFWNVQCGIFAISQCAPRAYAKQCDLKNVFTFYCRTNKRISTKNAPYDIITVCVVKRK